jgi:protein-export membrane protein SecD
MAINKTSSMTNRQKLWLKFTFIVIIFVFFAGIVYPELPTWIPGKTWFDKFKPKLGLDLQGGAHLVFEADTSSVPTDNRVSAVEGVRDVIERRINAFGIAEPLVQTNKQGDNYRVIVELAGVFDVNEAINQIGETPLLEFKKQNSAYTDEINLTPEQQIQLNEYNNQAKQRAVDLLQKINNGDDFSQLAKENSEDPGSKDVGGELGFVKKNMLVPEFEKAIFDDLLVNEIATEPIETQFGYHLIQKLEEKGFGDEREVNSRHILVAKITAQDLIPPQDQWINTELSGKHLEKVQVVFDPNTNQPQVSLVFNAEGKELFSFITKENLNKPVAIFLDGQPISIPTVQTEITNGEAVITGDFTTPEAKLLAQRLNAGALPIPINLIAQQNIGPSLGSKSLELSFFAGIIGLLAVGLFMILYYRLPGLVAVISLIIYGVIVFGIFKIMSVTLTLAGITGFIMSVGMAVDANVLIFERLKEELKDQQPLDNALTVAFKRAWPAIRDSNVSTMISAIILFWFGTSVIKGFALTLSIGILVSMFTAIVISRTILELVITSKVKKYLWLFGYHK